MSKIILRLKEQFSVIKGVFKSYSLSIDFRKSDVGIVDFLRLVFKPSNLSLV